MWENDRLPCPGQRVILAEDDVVKVGSISPLEVHDSISEKFLFQLDPKSLVVGPELVLPMNGMIIFPSASSGVGYED